MTDLCSAIARLSLLSRSTSSIPGVVLHCSTTDIHVGVLHFQHTSISPPGMAVMSELQEQILTMAKKAVTPSDALLSAPVALLQLVAIAGYSASLRLARGAPVAPSVKSRGNTHALSSTSLGVQLRFLG